MVNTSAVQERFGGSIFCVLISLTCDAMCFGATGLVQFVISWQGKEGLSTRGKKITNKNSKKNCFFLHMSLIGSNLPECKYQTKSPRTSLIKSYETFVKFEVSKPERRITSSQLPNPLEQMEKKLD